jgi:hypothetical protein
MTFAGSPVWSWMLFSFCLGIIVTGIVSGGIYLNQRNEETSKSKGGEVTPIVEKPRLVVPRPPVHNLNLPIEIAEVKPPILPPVAFLPLPEARAENGWPVYELQEEGFALSLPEDWRQIDLNPEKFEANISEMLKRNPEFKPVIDGFQKQIASGVKFIGINQTTMTTGLATNVNVLRLPIPPWMTLDSVVEETLNQMGNLSTISKPIFHERVKIAGVEVERLSFQITINNPVQKIVQSMTQFVMFSDGEVYFVTFGTLSNRQEQDAPIIEKIAKSFRLIKRRQD